MKKLIVYYKLVKMSKGVASRGELYGPPKQYQVQLCSKEFPADTLPEDAYALIYAEFDTRPDGSRKTAHSFAEVVSHVIT